MTTQTNGRTRFTDDPAQTDPAERLAYEQDPEQDESHGSPSRALRRAMALLRLERRDIRAIFLFALCVAVLTLATPIAIEALVNTVAFGVMLQPVIILTLLLFGFLALAATIRSMQAFLVEYLQQRLFVRVVSDFAHRVPRAKLEHFDHEFGPDLLNRFFDIINVQKSVASLLTGGVSTVVSTIVGMVVLAFYHPWLIGFDVALLILLAVLIFVLGRGGIRTSLHESHAKYEAAFWLQELARDPRTFKLFGGPQLALHRANETAEEYIVYRRAHFKIVWRQILFTLALQVVVQTALLGLGGYMVINQMINLGQLVAAELIVSLIVASFAKMTKQISSFYDLCAGAEKLGKVINLPLEQERGEPLPSENGGLHIETDIGPAKWTLEPEDKVVLAGPPGVGKSRFLDLLCGLRQQPYGTVRVNGIDLRDLRDGDYRSRVALVRGPDVIAGAILDNLRLGREGVKLSRIRWALEKANLGREVHSLPEGLHTKLLPGGSPLSRTQAVRLCIARAMIGPAGLLVIDGALDELNLDACPELLPALFDRSAPRGRYWW